MNKLPLDDLPAMALFAQVARLASFSAAAREAGVVKSVVSKRIAALEGRLGVRLLMRTTRKLVLTSEGLAFYEHCAALVAAARAAAESVGEARSERGTIRVNATGAFAIPYLTRAITAFLLGREGVDVHLVTDERFVDLGEGGADVLVRVSRKLRGSAVVRRLATDRLRVVAAPSYLARAGEPTSPSDLVHHNCLRYSHMTASEEWQLRQGDRHVPVPVTGNFTAADPSILREAALAGLGLAVVPNMLVAHDLAAGRLTSVLEAHANIPLGIHVLLPHRTQLPARTRAFVDFLSRHFAAASLDALRPE